MMDLKIKKIDSSKFQDFIRKLMSVDKYISMKINDKTVSSSTHLPQRDAVKVVSYNLEDMFEIDGVIDKPIKISFYDAKLIISALSYFGDSDIQGTIKYDSIGDEYIASDFIIFNKNLKINLYCADPMLSFIEMSKEQLKLVFNTDTSKYTFEINKEGFSQMKNLFKLDSDVETFKIYYDGNNALLKGKNYENILSSKISNSNIDTHECMVYKKYFDLIDKNEAYDVSVCDNKLFFKSKVTNTMLILAVCIQNED